MTEWTISAAASSWARSGSKRRPPSAEICGRILSRVPGSSSTNAARHTERRPKPAAHCEALSRSQAPSKSSCARAPCYRILRPREEALSRTGRFRRRLWSRSGQEVPIMAAWSTNDRRCTCCGPGATASPRGVFARALACSRSAVDPFRPVRDDIFNLGGSTHASRFPEAFNGA